MWPPPIDTYRIKTDRWHRTWQAEWNGCLLAPRAWTERGVRRKALRWVQESREDQYKRLWRHRRRNV